MKLVHINHLEEMVIDEPATVISLLDSMWRGGRNEVATYVKYDGGSTLWAGRDSRGFFIATKRLFNKSPVKFYDLESLWEDVAKRKNKVSYNIGAHANQLEKAYLYLKEYMYTYEIVWHFDIISLTNKIEYVRSKPLSLVYHGSYDYDGKSLTSRTVTTTLLTEAISNRSNDVEIIKSELPYRIQLTHLLELSIEPFLELEDKSIVKQFLKMFLKFRFKLFDSPEWLRSETSVQKETLRYIDLLDKVRLAKLLVVHQLDKQLHQVACGSSMVGTPLSTRGRHEGYVLSRDNVFIKLVDRDWFNGLKRLG